MKLTKSSKLDNELWQNWGTEISSIVVGRQNGMTTWRGNLAISTELHITILLSNPFLGVYPKDTPLTT